MTLRPRELQELEKALRAKEYCERAGHPVKGVTLDGKKISLEFSDTAPLENPFEIVDMKR
jgi:hypothetical protein